MHTPGPWALKEGVVVVPSSHLARSLGGSIDPSEDARRFAWPIARITQGGLPRYSNEETSANARLIADAPTMLAALQYIASSYPTTDEGEWMAEEAREAIKEATKSCTPD